MNSIQNFIYHLSKSYSRRMFLTATVFAAFAFIVALYPMVLVYMVSALMLAFALLALTIGFWLKGLKRRMSYVRYHI